MKRRDLLASGVTLGLAMAGEAVFEHVAEAARDPKLPTFYQGLLSGGDIANWELLVSTRNRVVTGLAQAPGQQPGQGQFQPAVNLRGRLVGADRVNGNLFDITDRGFQNPLGTFDGRIRRRTVSGKFSFEGTPGNFAASMVMTDPRAARPFAGHYDAELCDDAGNALFTLDIRVQVNGAWTISNITPTSGGPPVEGIFTGFGATNRDRTDGYGFSNNDFAACGCAIPTTTFGQATGKLDNFNFSTNYRGHNLFLNLHRMQA